MRKLKEIAQRLRPFSAKLALAFVAAGSVVTAATSSSEPGSLPAPPPESAVDARLEAFCDQYWGSMSEDGSYCRFEQVFHVNADHVGSAPLLTNIALVPGDTVSVASTNTPDAMVGAAAYGNGRDGFVSRTSGYLSFRAPPGQEVFSVQRVRLRRCFDSVGSTILTVACPPVESVTPSK